MKENSKMRITQIEKTRLARSMVRGFFQSYVFGKAEQLFPEVQSLEPRHYKEIISNNYEHLANEMLGVFFPLLVRLNFKNADAATEDLAQRKFSSTTSPKLLLRYACGSKVVYDSVVEEYRIQIENLLSGHLQPMSEFFNAEDMGSDESIGVALAIRTLVRTQMQTYAKAKGGEADRLSQKTIYRLMIHGMIALLHTEVPDISGENLELIFRRVAKNSNNFETLMDEMTRQFSELAE